jgi:hypothetical protein
VGGNEAAGAYHKAKKRKKKEKEEEGDFTIFL